MKTLALIPCRGGSKRLKRKNIKKFCGKPLFMWSVEAARKAGIERIVVSTEDEEILMIAIQNNVEVLKRPDVLARDNTPSIDVMNHCIRKITGYDRIVLLQPTSPLRTSKNIEEALELGNSVVSRCEQTKEINGAIYIQPYKHLDYMAYDKTYWMSGCIDIDTENDFKAAERVMCIRS